MDSKTLCEQLARASGCEVRGDDLTRALYATDASIYQVLPKGVAFPRTSADVAGLVRAAGEAGVSLVARGAGSGLAGGAVGEGIVVDFSRHMNRIIGFDRDRGEIRVEPGVVLDTLNTYLRPFGLQFGPDVATSSRATLGGMIGNNSSGARASVYGATSEHVLSLEVVDSWGEVTDTHSPPARDLPIAGALKRAESLVTSVADLVRQRFHDRIPKRWPGYGFDRVLREMARQQRLDPAMLITGSEGTLGLVTAATLRVVPLPREKGLVVLFFPTVRDALEASVRLLPLRPAAIEHIDHVLFDQIRGQSVFATARAFLELDEKPHASILMVEFEEDAADRARDALRAVPEGRGKVCGPEDAARVWALRKAGLSLLTGCPGPAKPTAGIEDVCVPPERLAEYAAALGGILDREGLRASFYGHAGSGLLHVRPVVDLHLQEDIRRFRRVAEACFELSRAFEGSPAAEHGVGIARTEFLASWLGPELWGAMAEVKRAMDPRGLLNPGKIIDTGRYRFDRDLRQGAGYRLPVPFEPVLGYVRKDRSFTGNLEQCNGCGGCRKTGPTMCPTFQATGDELLSTRGRANVIRAVLESRLGDPEAPLLSDELEQALENCLSCRACATECPSNVNMPLLKAELLYARHRKHGVPLVARLLSRVDWLGWLGTRAPGLANRALAWPWLRGAMKAALGLTDRRPLPAFAAEPFDRWWRRHRGNGTTRRGTVARGPVILWLDCFARYYEPDIARAAVTILEMAGYEVVIPWDAACCGRPAFSMGRLDLARAMGARNIEVLSELPGDIVFLEPSCGSMLAEDYAELKLPGAEALSRRALSFELFIDRLLERDPGALPWHGRPGRCALHVHCHAKAMVPPERFRQVAARVPGVEATLLDSGCCGMAGAFGSLESKYDLSVEVARPLVDMVNALPADTDLVVSGTSCRHQLTHLASRVPAHFAVWLASCLRNTDA